MGRVLVARTSVVAGASIVVLAIALSWGLTYLLGGAGHVAPHWFYAPILLAAARFGLAGALLTAAGAGVVAGPLTPLDVALATAQPLSDWTSRAAFFIGNGFVMAIVIGRLKAALGRELGLARAERELARHKEAVIQTVSHEFRTPLTVMRGTVKTLEQRGLFHEDARPLIESLERSTMRLDKLMRIVVAASETLIDPRRRRQEFVSLRQCCDQAVAATGSTSSGRIRLSLSPEASVLFSDPELFSLILGEVIDNALKFSPPESPVFIAARRVGSTFEVRIKDQGPGMIERYQRHAFEPFTQEDQSTTRQREGLGIGLFAARKAVELLGGTIEARSEATGGTEVIIMLPQRRVLDPTDSAELRPSDVKRGA